MAAMLHDGLYLTIGAMCLFLMTWSQKKESWYVALLFSSLKKCIAEILYFIITYGQCSVNTCTTISSNRRLLCLEMIVKVCNTFFIGTLGWML